MGDANDLIVEYFIVAIYGIFIIFLLDKYVVEDYNQKLGRCSC